MTMSTKFWSHVEDSISFYGTYMESFASKYRASSSLGCFILHFNDYSSPEYLWYFIHETDTCISLMQHLYIYKETDKKNYRKRTNNSNVITTHNNYSESVKLLLRLLFLYVRFNTEHNVFMRKSSIFISYKSKQVIKWMSKKKKTNDQIYTRQCISVCEQNHLSLLLIRCSSLAIHSCFL